MTYPGLDGSRYPDPVYLGETGEATARIRRAGQEPELPTTGGSASYLATGAATRGQFGLYRWDMRAGAGGPAPHFHRTISESFYVLSGTVMIHDGTDYVPTRAGDFCFVPEGGIHGFRNDSAEPASMLLLFTPGAPREAYFEGLMKIMSSERQPSPLELEEFFARHDNHWV